MNIWWYLIGFVSVVVFRLYEDEPICILFYPLGVILGPIFAAFVFLWAVLDIKF